jgi:hypothetical protein
MFGERRKHQRVAINRIARIQATGGGASTECTITDISDRGARLYVSDAKLPERFFLLIDGDRPIRNECQLIWRLGGEAGVEFAFQAGRHRVEAMSQETKPS